MDKTQRFELIAGLLASVLAIIGALIESDMTQPVDDAVEPDDGQLESAEL